MSTAVKVSQLPVCDWANGNPKHPRATYDFKTQTGPWANGCQQCYMRERRYTELGTGKGQKLFIDPPSGVVARPRPVLVERLQDGLREYGNLIAYLDANGGEL